MPAKGREAIAALVRDALQTLNGCRGVDWAALSAETQRRERQSEDRRHVSEALRAVDQLRRAERSGRPVVELAPRHEGGAE
jgi:hypothetical protein